MRLVQSIITFRGFQAQRVPSTQLIDLLKGFGAENNDKVWSELSSVINTLDRLMRVLKPQPRLTCFLPYRSHHFIRHPLMFEGSGGLPQFELDCRRLASHLVHN